MKNILPASQIIVALLLIMCILLQPKGEGLSQTIGGSGELYKTRRGMEKILFSLTIILIILFFTVSVLSFLIK